MGVDQVTVEKKIEGLFVASLTHPLYGLVSGYGLSEQAAIDELRATLAGLAPPAQPAPGAPAER